MKSPDVTKHRTTADIDQGVLQIVIPYVNPELTQAAVRQVGVCTDLNVEVNLIDIQVIPFPCPLDQPLIDKEYSQRRLEELLGQSGLPGRATLLYTRDWLQAFCQTMEPKSLVILATATTWWPTREKKLARTLAKAGYQVMVLTVR
jgi:hypothetical protein